jgi:hypothetical protein
VLVQHWKTANYHLSSPFGCVTLYSKTCLNLTLTYFSILVSFQICVTEPGTLLRPWIQRMNWTIWESVEKRMNYWWPLIQTTFLLLYKIIQNNLLFLTFWLLYKKSRIVSCLCNLFNQCSGKNQWASSNLFFSLGKGSLELSGHFQLLLFILYSLLLWGHVMWMCYSY